MYLICKGNESKITMTKEKAKTVMNSTYLDDIRVVEHPKGVLWDGNLNYNQSKFRINRSLHNKTLFTLQNRITCK